MTMAAICSNTHSTMDPSTTSQSSDQLSTVPVEQPPPCPLQPPVPPITSFYSFVLAGISSILNACVSNPVKLAVLVLFFSFITVNLYIFNRSFEDIANQAVSFSLDTFTVVDLNDDGANFRLLGELNFDCDRISGHYVKSVVKLVSVAVGALVISPKDVIGVYMGYNGTISHLVDVEVPQKFNLALDGVPSPFELAGNASVLPVESGEFLNKWLEDPSIEIEIHLMSDVRIDANWLSIRRLVDFSDNVIIESQPPEISYSNLTVFQLEESHSIGVDIDVIVETSLIPLKLDFSSSIWDLYIEGCQDLIYIGMVEVPDISVGKNSTIATRLSIAIPELSEGCLELCDISPINKYAISMLNNDEISIYLRFNSGSVPHWFTRLFHQVYIPLSTSYPLDFGDVIQESSIKAINIIIPAEGDHIIIDSNVTLTGALNNIDIDFDIPLLKGKIEMEYNNSVIGQLTLEHWQNNRVNQKPGPITNSSDSESLFEMELNIYNSNIDIYDPEPFIGLLRNFLDGNDILNMGLSGIFDFQLKTSVEDSILQSIEKSFKVDLPAFDNTTLYDLETYFDSIDYLDSNESLLRVLVHCGIYNPFNASIALDRVSMDIYYNHSWIGVIGGEDIFVPAGTWFNTSLEVELKNGVVVDEFMSYYVSGISKYLTIENTIINDDANSIISSISRMLSISVPLPTHQSGFVIESTLHVFSSDVEVTILNPLSREILVTIVAAEAVYKETVLGYIDHSVTLNVPPGIYTTPRIPIVINKGIGSDILRRALNGELEIDGIAYLSVNIGDYKSELVYTGSGLNTKIKL